MENDPELVKRIVFSHMIGSHIPTSEFVHNKNLETLNGHQVHLTLQEVVIAFKKLSLLTIFLTIQKYYMAKNISMAFNCTNEQCSTNIPSLIKRNYILRYIFICQLFKISRFPEKFNNIILMI